MIVNQFGTPYKFLDSSQQRYNRPLNQSPKPKDFDDLISNMDHATVVGRSKKLFSNNGTVKGAIFQKSMYAVGNAWLPQSLSLNKEWKKQATDYLSKWYRVADVKGFDFQTCLFLASVEVDKSGDIFIVLTKSKEGYPQIQMIPAHRVGQRSEDKTVTTGSFKGFKIRKGIIQNKQGRAIAYRVLGDTEDQDRDIPAQDMIHLFEPETPEQSRGLPLFSHCINSFADMEESTRREMTAQLLLASIAFTEHNDYGGIDLDDVNVNISDVGSKATYEEFGDGTIKYFRADTNSKITELSNNRPGVNWQEFHNRIERACLLGANWPKALLDATDGLNGTENRMALKIAEQSVKDRQNLLFPAALRIVTWVISKAIKSGDLPTDPDFYKWSFSKPPFISIDFGRDALATRENYKLGLVNLTTICESEGTTLEDHLRERAAEAALSILIRQETEQQYGVKIDPRDIKLFGPLAITKDPEE